MAEPRVPKPFKRGNVWYLRFTTTGGKRKRVSLRARSEREAHKAAARILLEQEQLRAGTLDMTQVHARTPIDEHVGAFERSLRCSDQQRSQILLAIQRLLEHQGILTLRDLTVDAVNRWIARHRGLGKSTTTLNHYQSYLRQFSRWLWATDRVRTDPLKTLAPFPMPAAGEDDGGAFDRRALTDDELRALLEATPMPRRAAYLLAATTGLRRGELAQLRWEEVDLARRQVTVRAGTAKARRVAYLPLVPGAVDALEDLAARGWARRELDRLRLVVAKHATATKAAEELGVARSTLRRRLDRLARILELPEPSLVFPGGRWCYPDGRGPGVPTVERLHQDLDRGGVAIETEAGLVDLHSLRTTFGTALARAGVPLAIAQVLMRHSSPVLTARYYTRVEGQDKRAAVAAMWTRLAEQAVSAGEVIRLTGTA